MSVVEKKLPKGWVNVSLAEIRLDESKTITPKQFKEKQFELYSVPIFNSGLPEIIHGNDIGSNKQIVEEDTVLLCKINPRINRVWIVGNFSTFLKIASTEWIPFFKINGIFPKFLQYFLQNNDFRNFLSLNVSGVGGSLTRIRPSILNEYQLMLPPLNEQKRIVAKIEELFSLVDSAKKNLEKTKIMLKQYRQSILKHAFEGKLTEEWRINHFSNDKLTKISELEIVDGSQETHFFSIPESWFLTTIEKIYDFIGSGITPRGGKSVYVNTGIPFIRSQNVFMSGLKTENISYVTKLLHEQMSRTHLKEMDVLLNITGASIGRSTYVPNGFGQGNVNQHVCIIRTSKLYPPYLSYYLNSYLGQLMIFAKQKGETRQGLNYSQLKSIIIPFCSNDEQKEIVAKIEESFSIIEKNETLVDTLLQQFSQMKNSILKSAFEGKLVPQDPNDEPAEILLQKIQQERTKK